MRDNLEDQAEEGSHLEDTDITFVHILLVSTEVPRPRHGVKSSYVPQGG